MPKNHDHQPHSRSRRSTLNKRSKLSGEENISFTDANERSGRHRQASIIHRSSSDSTCEVEERLPEKIDHPAENLHLEFRKQAAALTHDERFSEATETINKIQRLTHVYQPV